MKSLMIYDSGALKRYRQNKSTEYNPREFNIKNKASQFKRANFDLKLQKGESHKTNKSNEGMINNHSTLTE